MTRNNNHTAKESILTSILEKSYETAHTESIRMLVNYFGEDSLLKIEEVYGNVRKGLEVEARIKTHIPSIAYKQTREDLERFFNE